MRVPGLALTSTQGKWKRTAKQLADHVLRPSAAAVDTDGTFPERSLGALAHEGLFGLLIPAAFGGQGQDVFTAVLVLEELAQACASTAMCFHMHTSTTLLLSKLVAADQVRELIAPVCQGERFGTLAMSEPGSGNRLWHMDSHATKDHDRYLVNARKSFVTSAGRAHYYLVPVRADSAAKPHEISLFVIDGADPGVKPIGTWDGMGMRGNCSTPIHFDNCEVPTSRLLGAAKTGFSVLFAYTFPVYQLGLAAVYLGVAQSSFDAAVNHVKSRVHTDTNRPLAHVETVQRYIAEMRLRLEQTRSFVYRTAQLVDGAVPFFDELQKADLLDEVVTQTHDDPFFGQLASIKVVACETAIDVTNKALQVCGGTGYRRGHPVERNYRDARAGSVMGPSDDALKLLLASQLLGVALPWQ